MDFFKMIEWLIESFFLKELIILTPRGVDFTTIPVTESCISHSHMIVFDNYESKINKRQLITNQVFCTIINLDWDNHLLEMIQ